MTGSPAQGGGGSGAGRSGARAGRAGRARNAPDVPALGSVSRRQADSDEPGRTCAGCGRPTTTRIRLALPDGRPALFVSCEACERTSWYEIGGDGTPLTRTEILGSTQA
ncbi:hypothetical protein [Cellulomonas soli]